MKQRVEEMEREANKLRELQAAAENAERASSEADTSVPMETEDDKAAADSRSVFVGNVSGDTALDHEVSSVDCWPL